MFVSQIMKHRISVLIILLLGLSFSYSVRAQDPEISNIRDIMEDAKQLRDDPDVDLSQRSNRKKYRKELKDSKNSLETIQEKLNKGDQTIDKAFLLLEISTLINSLDGRIKQVVPTKKLRPCEECTDDNACADLCSEYRDYYRTYRNKYRRVMQYDLLDCNDCLKNLENYYAAIEKMFRLQTLEVDKIKYYKESVSAMWGNLYRISRDDACLESAQNKLQNIMLPFLMPPDKMIIYFSIIFSELDEKEKGELMKKMLGNEEEAILIYNFIVQIFKNIDPENLKEQGLRPSDLAEALTRLINTDIEMQKDVPVSMLLEVIKKHFDALSEDEQEKLADKLSKNQEDMKEVAGFLIQMLRQNNETHLEVIKKLNLSYNEIARILENNPEIIHRLAQNLDTVELLQTTLKKIEKLSEDEKENLLKRSDLKTSVLQFLDELRNTREGYELFKRYCEAPCTEPVPPPENKYLKSFLMPTYMPVHYNQANRFEKVWFYSNFTVLGLSLASTLAFVETDYEHDSLYWAGVGGLVFCFLNGGGFGTYTAHTFKPASTKKIIENSAVKLKVDSQKKQLLFTYRF